MRGIVLLVKHEAIDRLKFTSGGTSSRVPQKRPGSASGGAPLTGGGLILISSLACR